MSAKAIYEADGKELLTRYLRQTVPQESALRSSLSHKAVVVTHVSDLNELTSTSPWITSEVRKLEATVMLMHRSTCVWCDYLP